MAKRLDVYTTLLVVLVFVAGCPRPKAQAAYPLLLDTPKAERIPPVPNDLRPDETAPAKPEPDKSESARTEPNDITPAETDPEETEADKPKPDKPEPDSNEPSANDPNRTTPVEPSPPQADPNETVSVAADPNETAPVAVGPNQPDPNRTVPLAAGPNQPDPNRTVPLAPDPNQADPNNVQPSSADANDLTPAGAEPNDIDPNDIDPNDLTLFKTEPNDPNIPSAASFQDKCAPILKKFVGNNGMVSYKTLRYKKPDLRALLNEFNKLDPNDYESWSKEDKIALLINAYNLKMLDIIVKNYPIKPLSRFHSVIWGPKSVRHIQGIWTKYKFFVTDEVFTLKQINERFFKEFRDPRILFALTRASLSSPPLRNEPYYGHKLNKQLDDQVRKFLAGPSAFRIDKAKGKVYLSALFQKDPYGKEFIANYGTDKKFKGKEAETRAVLNFITNYISEDAKSYLELGNYTVQFMGYNWTINDGS
ncbi:MAG: DUF547 domain-containing protein [Phycisphaerae bacterium]|nr:DUF547 domain-containing protein [Phycisphaerae bacterium]